MCGWGGLRQGPKRQLTSTRVDVTEVYHKFALSLLCIRMLFVNNMRLRDNRIFVSGLLLFFVRLFVIAGIWGGVVRLFVSNSLMTGSLWATHWWQVICVRFTDDRLFVSNSLMTGYLWATHWWQVIYERLTDDRFFVSDSLMKGYLWATHWWQVICERFTDDR